jgi:hypothetical protein
MPPPQTTVAIATAVQREVVNVVNPALALADALMRATDPRYLNVMFVIVTNNGADLANGTELGVG